MMMHGTHSQQHGNGDVVRAGIPITENDDRLATVHRLRGLLTNTTKGREKGFTVAACGKMTGEGHWIDIRVIHLGQRIQLVFQQEGRINANQTGVLGRFLQPGATMPHTGRKRHDHLLANTVDGRIGDLSKQLLEVGIKQFGPLAQDRQRGVISHASNGFGSRRQHGLENDFQFFTVPAKGNLLQGQIQNIDGLGGRFNGLGMIGQRYQMLITPLTIGLLGSHLLLDLVIVHQAPFFGVDGHDLAWSKPSLAHNETIVQFDHAGLTAKDHQAVFVKLVAGGSQAVAVQGSSHKTSICENHCCRSIPWFVQAGMIAIEIPHALVHTFHFFPCFGSQHEHAVKDVSPTEPEDLQSIVERRRVGTLRLDDLAQTLNVISPNR